MPAPANPYIAGPPIGGETGFFGRDEIIAEVERVLRYPPHNSVILYGPRRSGKTSLLLQIERRLPTPPFFTVYFDLAGHEMLPVSTVLYQMATAAADKAGMPPPHPADFENSPDAFHENFLPALYQALGMRLQPIFLLDEFDPIDTPEAELPENCAVRNLDTYLYQLISTQTHTDFIFAAGRRIHELSEVESSAFQPNLSRFVGVLTPDDARALITQPGAPAYTDDAISRILEITRGQPYFTQLLGQALVASARPGRPVSKDEVKAGLTELVARPDDPGMIALWDSIPPAERLTLAAAAGRTTGPLDIVSQAAIDGTLRQAGVPLDTPGLAAAAPNLVNWQLFEQSGGGYNFFTEFFRRWTAQNRPLEQIKADELARIHGRVPARPAAAPQPPAKPVPPPRRPEPPAARRNWWPIAIALLLLLLLCAWLLNPARLIAPGTETPAPVTQTESTATPLAPVDGQEPTAPAESPPVATLPPPTDSTSATAGAAPTTEPAPETPATATEPPPLAGQVRVAVPPELKPALEQAALAYSAQQPSVQVVVANSGSPSGLSALQQGQVDVVLLARNLTPEEQASLGNAQVRPLPQSDPLALIIHPLVKIDDLSPDQIRAIFAGEITNWSEVGGPDAAIRLVLPEAGSDSRLVIEQQILGPDTPPAEAGAIVVSSDEAVRAAVAETPYAVGLVPADGRRQPPLLRENWAVIDTLLLQAKTVSVGQTAPGSEGYPLGRPLNLIAPASASPAAQSWIDFVLSAEGQQLIKQFRQTNP